MAHRNPYVGEGIDGCLRSATIDLSEADSLARPGQDGYDERADDDRARLNASAQQWMNQALDLAGCGRVRKAAAVPGVPPQYEYAVATIKTDTLADRRAGDLVGLGAGSYDAAHSTAEAFLTAYVPVQIVVRPVPAPWAPLVS